MPKHEEIPTTDTAQIERLIERLKQGKLQEQDARLIETLLHFVLNITSLLKRGQQRSSVIRSPEMITRSRMGDSDQ